MTQADRPGVGTHRLVRAACLVLALMLAGPAFAQQPGGLSPRMMTLEQTSYAPITGARVACADSTAAAFRCHNVDLLAFLPLAALGNATTTSGNDLWGWTDPETGREYALVGLDNGTSFVDVTDPVNPVVLGMLPSHNGTASLWRDVKVYRNHALIVSEAYGHGLQVFDLTQLRTVEQPPVTFRETAHYDAFGAAHNVVVNEESGFAYAVGIQGIQAEVGCGPGLHMIDVREPARPAFAGCFNSSVGRGYTHDAHCVLYRGPDAEHQGREICINADERGIVVVDVTDKQAPVERGVGAYPDAGYVHQGWLTEDHRYFFQDDELDEAYGTTARTRTLVWDLEDLDDPRLYLVYHARTDVYDHNQYVRGDRLYQANYRAGLRILDLGDLASKAVSEVGFFDTYPAADGPGFDGAWSVYPFFESGTILVNDMDAGLFVLEPTHAARLVARDSAVHEAPEVPGAFELAAAYPNPFNPATRLTLTLGTAQRVTLAVYDALGREVARLHDGPLAAGTHAFVFEAPAGLPSGSYVVRATGPEAASTRTITLLK
ncbi:MAG: choice-of-anchor B family protein [Bacteroidetes bacterium]|nr:MAG: choice-of-anchor B family protein [Bacteroidota bacterium]